MSANSIVGRGDTGSARPGRQAKNRAKLPEAAHLVGRKSVLLGMLTSGFVVANAAQPSAIAGTIKPIAATTPAYVTKWVPSTAYVLGQQVVSPNNDVVSANEAHTSSAAYATDSAKWDFSSTFSRVNLPNFASADGVRFVSTAGLDTNTGCAPGSAMLTVQAAHDALPATGGTIMVGAGKFAVTTPIVFTKPVILQGQGNGGAATKLLATTGNLFNVTTDWNGNTIRDVVLVAATGHIINVGSGHNFNGSQFTGVSFWQWGTGYSVMNMPDGGMIGNLFDNCNHTHDPAATVPTWNLISSSGGLNCNTWQHYTATYSGLYAFHLENTTANYCYDNTFAEINFEVCGGGAVRILSGHSNELRCCQVYDLSGLPTRDLFVIGKSPAGPTAKLNVLRHVGRRGGSVGSGIYDINLAGSALTTLDSCNSQSLNGYAINCGGGLQTLLNTDGLLSNDGSVTQIASGVIKTSRSTTGQRVYTTLPGAQSFDTTLGKPIWWSGTVWKDAAGNTV
jgi:hypothetical protein